jgi:hypothetical protein
LSLPLRREKRLGMVSFWKPVSETGEESV